MSIGSEMNNDVGEKVSDLTKSKKCDIKLAAAPSDLLSKEGFALYIGNRQFDLPVGIVQFNIKLISLKAPVIRQGHAHQTVADIAGNIPAVEHQHVIRRQRTACIKCQRIQHYPAPVIPVNLVAILPALPMSDSACLPISP